MGDYRDRLYAKYVSAFKSSGGAQAFVNGEHLPVLDGIRGIAVLLVIGFHFWLGFSTGDHSLIGKLAKWGQTGVDLFFVLSGFLITGILLSSKSTEHFLRNFYVRRVLRIFPLYYATLISIYVLFPLLRLAAWTPWKQSVWFWFYLQNLPMTFSPSSVSGPDHFWSLAVEEHYYFVWPLLVMLLDGKKLLKVVGIAIAVSLLTRMVFLHYQTFYFTLARLDGLAIGSAVAIFARSYRDSFARLVPWAMVSLCVTGPVLAITQLSVSGSHLPVIEILKSTLIAVVYALCIVIAIENGFGQTIRRLLGGKVLGSFGKYSYAMYVLHPFVLLGVYRLGLRYGFAGVLASLALTYVAAWISWNVLEKRFLRLKRHFEYETREHLVDRKEIPSSISPAGLAVAPHYGAEGVTQA